jgi:anaerobic selenocysteine-containing dehydrogenase
MLSSVKLDVVTHRSVCPLDCPDTCSLLVDVKDNRVVALRGDAEHPNTQGFACVKMAKYPERQNHPERLLQPLKRVGPKGSGRFEPIDWESALTEIVQRLRHNCQAFGTASVLPYCYAGTMGLIQRDFPLAFFRALGASELDQTICATTASAGWEISYGPDKLSTPPESIAHSKLIILWGINVLRSNSHLAPFLKQARSAGATIVHIDPYHNETSRFADQHLSINVGTDAALALAIGGEILRLGLSDQAFLTRFASGFEEYRQACSKWSCERAATVTGIPADQIRQLAHAIGRQPQTFIKVGYGMSRNEGGGNAIRAIALLPALIGAWQHSGGGGSLSYSGAFQLNKSRYSGQHLLQPDRPHVNHNQLGRALESRHDNGSPLISSLFVFNSNPAAVAPDSQSVRRGLSREDLLTVVLELFQTDTADFADFVLPATMFTEHSDIYTAYGHYHLQWADAFMEAPPNCRSNSWVFQQLAKRMELNDPVFSKTTEQLAAELLETDHPFINGITFDQLRSQRSVQLNLPPDFRPYANGSHFADGKIRFSPPPQQIDFVVKPNQEYPLRLISPPGAFVLNTSMGNIPSLLKQAGGEPTILINPVDAATSKVRDGERVRIISSNGQIERKAIVTPDARAGVAIAVGQWWPKLAPDRRSLNDLTSQELTDLGGGSLFGNPVVRIEPCPVGSNCAG